MRYATLKGFESYAQAQAESIEDRYEDAIERMLSECEERMLAYILPNVPVTEREKAAFESAVYSQLVHEYSGSQQSDIPPGATSFKIGDFSMTLDGTPRGMLTRRTIAPAAWAYLLNAGLLYRGVCTV